jgi:hypothetical protein
LEKKGERIMHSKEIFKEDIVINKEEVIVTISCKKRTHIGEKKKIYKKNVKDLLPEGLRQKVSLEIEPKLEISNINNSNIYTNIGVWKFKIQTSPDDSPLGQVKKQAAKKPDSTRSQRRRTTRQNKSK